MKFLLALTVLVSAAAFSQPDHGRDHERDRSIKCYDSTQRDRGDIAYIFVKKDYELRLVYPRERASEIWLNNRRCLETRSGAPTMNHDDLEFCRTDGQRVNGLVPIEVTDGRTDTVYCERELLRYFNSDDILF
jgi:hypothetical protein